MKVSKTVFSTNAMAMLTTGEYFHPETGVGYENPVVKAHKIKDEKDIFMIYTEVSNLKQVKQYIDGGILTHKGERIALLLLVYQGHALTKENEEEYRPLMKESRDMYLREYHMLHLYVWHCDHSCLLIGLQGSLLRELCLYARPAIAKPTGLGICNV